MFPYKPHFKILNQILKSSAGGYHRPEQGGKGRVDGITLRDRKQRNARFESGSRSTNNWWWSIRQLSSRRSFWWNDARSLFWKPTVVKSSQKQSLDSKENHFDVIIVTNSERIGMRNYSYHIKQQEKHLEIFV